MRRRRRSLIALFETLNRSHFAGRLPDYSCRRWGSGSLFAAAKRPIRLGVHRGLDREIRIAGSLPERLERQVLLHEMCHAATQRINVTNRHRNPAAVAAQHGPWALWTSRWRDAGLLWGGWPQHSPLSAPPCAPVESPRRAAWSVARFGMLRTDGEHGSRWRAEMRRLAADHGEAWARTEADEYEAKALGVPVTELLG